MNWEYRAKRSLVMKMRQNGPKKRCSSRVRWGKLVVASKSVKIDGTQPTSFTDPRS